MPEPAIDPTPRELILGFAAKHGLTMESTFVPYSKSRNAKAGDDGKPWPSLNWRVRLMKAGAVILETDYSAGSGHAPAAKLKAGSYIFRTAPYSESRTRADLIAWEIENGKPGRFWGLSDGIAPIHKAEPIRPDFADVLYSLASDSEVLDAGGFAAWASEIGLDTDSRKAEATYRACLEIALKLRSALGDTALVELREAARDF